MADKKSVDTSVVGTTGLREYGGYVVEEFLRELSGTKGSMVYREMSDNDPIVGSIIFAITMLLRQVKWTVQPVDESSKATDAQEFVESLLDDMDHPFSSVVSEICSMFVYGFAPLEIVWKRRGGMDTTDKTKRSKFDDDLIGIRQLALRAQPTILRWTFDPEDGEVLGCWQQPISGTMVEIPMEKMLLFRTTTNRGNPEGRSVLRSAYRPWYFKRRMEEVEGIGVERDLAGLPVARIPLEYFDPAADAHQKATFAAWATLVKNIRRDKQDGILIPSDRDDHGQYLYDFQLLTTGGSRQFDTSRVITRYDQAIATSVLADFVLLGQRSSGSFALATNKSEIFATAMEAFLSSIADVLNRHLLPRVWKLNGMDYDLMPTLVPGDLQRADLAGLSALISSMAGAGATMFPDRDLENHLRELAGLPPAPEEGSMMDPLPMPGQQMPQDMIQPGMPGRQPAQPAAPGQPQADTRQGAGSQPASHADHPEPGEPPADGKQQGRRRRAPNSPADDPSTKS